ncbi:MAG: hypothetical protein HWN68_20005 [Desulfobacterales bacterium]|nr:hypothetical protein [Desulfobacterales bacterium]
METQKIGIVSLYRVKTTRRLHYITLDKIMVRNYDIKVGDVLKVDIKERVKRLEAEED